MTSPASLAPWSELTVFERLISPFSFVARAWRTASCVSRVAPLRINPSRLLLCLEELCRIDSISAGVKLAFSSCIKAMVPDTTGAAMLVPCAYP